jgi:hypothetical protein
LVDSLLDDDDQIRSTAAKALVALADEAALARLVAQLGEELPEQWSYKYQPIDEPPALDVLVGLGARRRGAD